MKVKFLCALLFFVSLSILNCPKSYGQTASHKKSDSVLAGYRSTIDSLDSSLIQLIGAREKIVREIGIYKAKNDIPPLQANRFQQVLEKSIAAGKEQGLSPEFITRLMNLIHDESLKLENQIKNK
ncbi:MAG TPA: chorismate mutase [Ferruginibacter sp.]|nr:chorismate mutase [Ferruginibacter sp.]